MSDTQRWTTITLHQGPLDGSTARIPADDPPRGLGLPSPRCGYPGGICWYQPDYDGLWVWRHDLPADRPHRH